MAPEPGSGARALDSAIGGASQQGDGDDDDDEDDEDDESLSGTDSKEVSSDCGCCFCLPGADVCCPAGRCPARQCCGRQRRIRCPLACDIDGTPPPSLCYRCCAAPIDPDGAGKVRFDVIVALATIYTAFMAPFQAAFGNVHELQAVEALTEALFVLHIWTEFRTAFEDPHKPGELISSLPRIARRYCRGWFLPDAVASFPFEILLVILEAVAHSSIGSVNTSNVLRALAVLRVLRLLRVGRLWVIARRLKVTAFVRLARLLFSFVLGAHIIACLFWSLPYLERYSGQYASLPPLLQAGPQSWAEMNGLMDESVAARTQYTFSIYWTVATLVSVGYGDVHAVSVGEQAFSVVVMTAGAITYSVLFGSVATLLASLNAHEAKFRQKIDAVDAFMRELRLPKRLQQRGERSWSAAV